MARGLWAALAAAERRSQREAARRYRALMQAQQRQTQLMDEAHAVHLHQSYIEMISTLHRDACERWDWQEVARTPAPSPARKREAAAAAALQSYYPTFFDRMLGRDMKRTAALEDAIRLAQAEDQAEHERNVERWQWFQGVAHGVLRGDAQAYTAVLEYLAPFDEIEQLGASVTIEGLHAESIEAQVVVRNPDIVPHQEVTLTAKGRVSRKQMAKAKYWGYYQDYVCSAALRVARELFHVLPINAAFVHVGTIARSTATGHMELQVLLSAQFDRRAVLSLNFDHIDASDAVTRLPHTMSFKKTAGFTPVDKIDPLAWIS